MRTGVSYRDALVLLGEDPPALAALDRVLAGALGLATGGASDVVFSVFDAQPRIVLLGRDLLVKLRDKLRGTARAERSQRLAAAHAVIVVTAWFEALKVLESSVPRDDLRLAGLEAESFLGPTVGLPPPQPSPDLPMEQFLGVLGRWYDDVSSRLLRGLIVSDALGETALAEVQVPLLVDLSREAVSRYADLYARLAIEAPEFGFWVSQTDSQATRAEVRRALSGVESLLAGLAARSTATGLAADLAAEYGVVLGRPILAEGETPAGVRMPTLEEGYLDPDFRVRAVGGGELPASEDWWEGAAARQDLTEYLAGALTSPEATAAPLVVLGQPGAGKSVLTKVLAARLPAAGFLPVRVVLREVQAEAEIQDQVEQAIRAATGRRVEWPDVAAAAPGATPVVLLDGFDELLQATGVSQSDYLLKAARFQEREAAQGRPTVLLVTSRTAVADRARYPEGTVALRLEPFRDEQVARWLAMWNDANERRLRTRGLAPLPPDAVSRYGALAREPLLLMMLALYDADANALQRADGSAPTDESGLYEDLLASFAEREVGKSGAGLPAGEVAARVEQEMQRLSLVAFSMVNRGRQWVTEAELDADLTALVGGRRSRADADMRLPLSPGGIAVGRFFFVQRAQAISDDTRLQTFEFLHATFGEYLAARLTVQLAARVLDQRPALAMGRAQADDDLLYALLSFGPLSARQMLRFVAGCARREVSEADRPRLADALIAVHGDARHRTAHKHDDYAPATRATASRHGVYSANLVLLILSLEPVVLASRLFPGSLDPPGRWRGVVLLWRSALGEQDWSDLALSLSLRHTWTGERRDLEISLAGEPPPEPEPVDPLWLYHLQPDQAQGPGMVWSRTYSDEVRHKMDIAGGTNDSAVRHALEPVFRWLGGSILEFAAVDGQAASVAHDLISLLMLRGQPVPVSDLAAIYWRLSRGLVYQVGGSESYNRTALLMARFLREDASRLPAAVVSACVLSARRSRLDPDTRRVRPDPETRRVRPDPETRHVRPDPGTGRVRPDPGTGYSRLNPEMTLNIPEVVWRACLEAAVAALLAGPAGAQARVIPDLIEQAANIAAQLVPALHDMPLEQRRAALATLAGLPEAPPESDPDYLALVAAEIDNQLRVGFQAVAWDDTVLHADPRDDGAGPGAARV